MKTIILPGYSPRNEEWAKEVKEKLQLGHEVVVHEWRHWKSPNQSLSLKYETGEILKKIGSDKVNIIAKSVGTRVIMVLISQYTSNYKKDARFEPIQPGRLSRFKPSTSNLYKQQQKQQQEQGVGISLSNINKIILCGIPTKFETETARTIYSKGLSLISPSKLLIFQNINDPLASYATVEKFIHSINSEFKVIEKSRSDHLYPFYEAFQKFLSD